MLPALAQNPVDYDIDDDNLIDISNLEQLDAVRYDLDGNGIVFTSDMVAYVSAFPNPASQMGCPDNCLGYELKRDLDFKNIFSYASFVVYDPWVNKNESGFLPLGHVEGENLIPSFPSTPTSIFSIPPEVFSPSGSTPTAIFVSTPSLPGHSCSSQTSNAFTSIFEGNGYKIRNLFINRSSLSSGLFQCIGTNGKVRNLGLELVDITGASQTGGLAGSNAGIISNSYVLGGFISAYGDNVGGLAGNNDTGIISNSYSTANVTGLVSSEGSQVGGLVGFNKGQVLNSISTGDVRGHTAVGGLIGKDASVDSNILTKVFYNYSLSRVSAETFDVDGVIGEGRTNINLFLYNSRSGFFRRVYNFYVVSNSFWSSDNNGITAISLNGGLGFTNTQLKSQSIGTVIDDLYFEWSTTNWNFGSTSQYPAIKYNNTQATRSTPRPSFGAPSILREAPIGEDLEACDSDSSDSEKPDCGEILPGQRGPFLEFLDISGTNLSTMFIPEITNYEFNVHNNIASVTVSLRGASSLSSVTVNGNSLSSGTSTFTTSVSLQEGGNFIEVGIGDSEGTRSYIITINRFLKPQLQSVVLSAGSLFPSFMPGVFIYSTTVNHSVENITITPTVSGDEVITVGQNIVQSGSESPAIDLQEGSNLVTVKVSNVLEVQNYTFVIVRAALPRLTSLALSTGELLPEFNPIVTSYSTRVTKDTDEIDITPVGESGSTVRVNNQLITSEQPSASISLVLGTNNITVRVSNSVGDKDYNLEIVRISLPELKSITLSSGTLSPVFDPEVGNYSARVLNSVTSLTVTPTAHSTEAITVNGFSVVSGETSNAIPLVEGDNLITIRVTGYETHRDYFIRVYRIPLPELSDIGLSHGTLSPEFSSETTNYSVQVGSHVTDLTITPLAQREESISVNGELLEDEVDENEERRPGSAVVSLSEGSNTIAITASNGTENKSYILTVARAFIPELSSLTLSQGSLSPVFSSTRKRYSVRILSHISSFTVTPTVQSQRTVTVNGEAVVSGEASQAISLSEGSNTVTIVVSNSINESATYTITATRDTLPRLSMLSISEGNLSPQFSSEITSYSVRVPNAVTSLTVTPTAKGTERIYIPREVMSGEASQAISLSEGDNTISLLVGLSFDNRRYYRINVYRALSPGLYGLGVSNTSIQFRAGQTIYSATVPYSVNRVTVVPSALLVFTIMVNGEDVESAMQSDFIDLDEGDNTITVTVSNEFDEEKSYTIIITRIPFPRLSGIEFSPGGDRVGDFHLIGTLTPEFDPDVNFYTLDISVSVFYIKVTATAQDPDRVVSLLVNNVSVTSGELSQDFRLFSANPTFQVIIADAENSNTYRFTVRRRGDPYLNNIQLSHGTLSPVFARRTASYSAQVENSVKSITVTPTNRDRETIKVNGKAVVSGEASQAISLFEGDNRITVRAFNGVMNKEYTLNIHRTPLPRLRSVNMPQGVVLEPRFHPEVTEYLILAPGSLETFNLSFTAYDDEDITMDGASINSDQQFSFSTENLIENQPLVVRVTSATVMGERTYNFYITNSIFTNIKVLLEGFLQ